MLNASRLLVAHGGPGAGKTAALIALYETLTPDERSRAAFLTVSRPAGRELERRLRLASGDPLPPVWTLPQLPAEVLRAAGAAPVRILKETDRQRLLAWLLARECEREDAPPRLTPWAAARRAVAPDLSAAVGLLQRYRVSPTDFHAFAVGAENVELLTAIACMYSVYVETLAACDTTDFDGLNERALRALEAARPPTLPDILFVDDAQEMDALQARLVAALAGQTGHVAAAVDAIQRTQMYRGAEPDAAAALSAAMGATAETLPCEGAGMDGAAGQMMAAFGYPTVSGRAPAVAHILANTPEDEARLVAAAVRGATGRRAVLTRSNRAASAMQDALRKEGIAVAAAWAVSPYAQRFLRDALTLLRDTPQDDEDARAVRLRSGLRLLAGSDAPEGEVAAARLAGARQPDGPVPETVRAWVEEARTLGSLAEQVHSLCATSRWIPRLPEADRDAAARAYSDAMLSLMGLEETWRVANTNTGPMPPAEAYSDLRGILAAATFPDAEPSPAPDDEDGASDSGSGGLVDVLPIHHAAGRHWDHVILSELQDGGFPQHSTPSPFIPEAAADEVRVWLENHEERTVAMGRFERRAGITVEEERRLYLTALTRAKGTVTLACHVRKADHPIAPSWFFQKLLPDGMALSPQAPADWKCLLKDTLPERTGGLDSCNACPIGRCGGRGGAHHAPAVLDVALDAPPAPAISPGPPALTSDWKLSATALNDYFACPRKYFLAQALRLSDEGTDSTAAGTALHIIMEAFNKAAAPRDWNTLEDAMNTVFDDENSGRAFSSRAAWRLTQRKMRRALQRFYERTTTANADFRWIEEWLDFSLVDRQGQDHDFRGKVDLAIRGHNGLEIIDFKSSRPRENVNALRNKLPVVNSAGGVEIPDDPDVQLALYAVGARANGDLPASVAHEYITISRPNDGTRLTIPIVPRDQAPPDGKGVLILEDLDAFDRFFGDTAREIKETAAFAADPASGECAFYNAPCAFAAICDRTR